MEKTYDWMEDAIEGIREHFRARNEARAQQGKRVYIRKRFVELLANGDMVYSVTYGGETVTLTNGAYNSVVSYN